MNCHPRLPLCRNHVRGKKLDPFFSHYVEPVATHGVDNVQEPCFLGGTATSRSPASSTEKDYIIFSDGRHEGFPQPETHFIEGAKAAHTRYVLDPKVDPGLAHTSHKVLHAKNEDKCN